MGGDPVSERSHIDAVQHMTKAFSLAMTVDEYAALPDRQAVTAAVAGMRYRDSAHPRLVFACVGPGIDWHRYWWEAYPWHAR
jgi:hypothetical protein